MRIVVAGIDSFSALDALKMMLRVVGEQRIQRTIFADAAVFTYRRELLRGIIDALVEEIKDFRKLRISELVFGLCEDVVDGTRAKVLESVSGERGESLLRVRNGNVDGLPRAGMFVDVTFLSQRKSLQYDMTRVCNLPRMHVCQT